MSANEFVEGEALVDDEENGEPFGDGGGAPSHRAGARNRPYNDSSEEEDDSEEDEEAARAVSNHPLPVSISESCLVD